MELHHVGLHLAKHAELHHVRHVELDFALHATKSENGYDECIKIEACNFFYFSC